jgi:putative transposase
VQGLGSKLISRYPPNASSAAWTCGRVNGPPDRSLILLHIEWRGKPSTIRVDNGPEYISGKLLIWASRRGITIQHIQPGQAQQNAYIERYNRTVRREWLDQYIIESIEPYGDCKQSPTGQRKAQDHATQWL